MIRYCFNCEVDLQVCEVDGYKLSKCLVRKKEVVLTPEEEVRQSVLFYLINYSPIDLNKLSIRVESQSLDIAFYLKSADVQFQPYQYPKIIFELKRDCTYLPDFTNQLKMYMERLKCHHGVLTNSSQLLYISQQNGLISKPSSISEIEKVISSLDISLEEDLQYFYLAQAGNYDCFKVLVQKYGKTSRFIFLSKDYFPPIQCIYLKVKDDIVFYDISGVKAKKKQFELDRHRFIKLISISN